MGTLLERYIEEEQLQKVKDTRPGEAFTHDGIHHSTARSYLTIINRHILPRWKDTSLTEVKAADVESWIKGLTCLPKPGADPSAPGVSLAPKTKGNVKSMMHRLMNRAMAWELAPLAINPIGLAEVRGISKRRKKPVILTIAQYQAVVSQLDEPYGSVLI